MAGSHADRLRRRSIVALGLALGCVVGASRPAEARPLRGPVVRAERRVARAQAALDRELARPAAQAAPRKPSATAPKAPAAAPASAAAVQSPAAGPRGGVAQATFEAAVPTRAEAGDATQAATREPAADGTYSVLVRPDADAAAASEGAPAQAGEPLRFPDASAP